VLARVVPPACLRGIDVGVPPRADADDIVLDCGVWSPRGAAVHVLPSFSPLDVTPPAFRFEVSARADGLWSPWVATVTLGDATFPPLPSVAGPLTADVDEFRASRPVDAVRLRVRCRGRLPRAWLVTLSCADDQRVGSAAPTTGSAGVSVPALSQLVEAPAIALRICSPTSVAMVLGYWGRAATAAAVAADTFHAGTDQFGVWPAAIRAAAARGVAGYLLRFPDWPAAAWCLARGIPIIASIRYAAGELSGAAIASTTGHLVVLTGYDNGAVLVNDPAAATVAEVPRRYPRAEVVRAWLEGRGVGYVLFDPARA
jgi:hypothetical protein